MNGIDIDVIKALEVADTILHTVKGIKDAKIADTLTKGADAITADLERFTGTHVEKLRQYRDEISRETHQIIQEEKAKTPIP